MRDRVVVLLLALALIAPATIANARKRVKRQPAQVQVERFTVVTDRRPDRLAEIARRLLAVDRFLTHELQVPAERLAEPVTVAYLHRTLRMDRRLPFRGDRIGHMHLLPTDTRLWVLVAEETGLEDLRYATIQVAELALERGPGEHPTWLRNGLFELFARMDVVDADLVLRPSSFPTLHAAGVKRAPLAATAEDGWSRYQEPQRWYTSQLAVAFLLDQGRLAEALDPDFDLVAAVHEADFDAWVDLVVVLDETEPRVILEDAMPAADALEPHAVSDEGMTALSTAMAMTHRRGARAFRLGADGADPHTAAWMELREGAPGAACAALVTDDTSEGLYLTGMCLWGSAPAAAEEAFRRAGRRGVAQGSAQAAALVLNRPGQEGTAALLLDDARRARPDDPDAELLRRVIEARGGVCPEGGTEIPASDTWSTIRYAAGPLEAYRAAFELEILKCGG
jgi:hypothetical protein